MEEKIVVGNEVRGLKVSIGVYILSKQIEQTI